MIGLKKYKLSELGKTFTGLNGKTKEDFGEGKNYIPYLNIFENYVINVSQFEQVSVGKNENQNKVQYGDIFFTTSSETVEEVGMASVLLDDVEETYLNSFCFGYRLNNFDALKPEFAPYLFRSEKIRQSISLLGQGSTRFNLSKNKLVDNIIVELPTIPEQTKIAEILSTMDKATEQTEAIIAKLQRIKTGLMQDLLTKGIDQNGNIRSEETHEFKDSPLGRIPVEWDVDTIDNQVTELLDFKANGSFESLTKNVNYYYEQNYARLIRLVDLRNRLNNPGVYIDKNGFKFLKKTRLVEGDILISCVGEYTGFVCQMPKVSYHATIAPNMFVVRFKDSIDNLFVAKYMTSSSFQNQILLVSTSSATKLLNNPNLRSLKLILPTKAEQKRISEKFNSIEELIKLETKRLANLISIKTGLMQDLLTVKVRLPAAMLKSASQAGVTELLEKEKFEK